MIQLSKKYLVNTGTNRACYIYPLKKEKCIKVNLKGHKETNQEIKYYKKLQNNSTSFDMISKYFGSVQTNLGNGEIFELIIDFDNNVSKEVDKYLINKDTSFDDIESIIMLLPDFKKYLFDQKIYVKDLNSVNVVFQKINENNCRLVVIDGLAHSNYNPFFYRLDFFILKKINISWMNFIKSIETKQIIQDNKELINILKTLY